jgi:DNA polymerase-3 subunit gamma/tau
MSYVVFARKYRPARFDDVIGQQHVSKTLKKALQTDHLAHAFLFCGPRGVGKTTCARILAKVLNCRNITEDFEPCGDCDSCRAFNENASFNIFELDGASNNQVDHMRALVDQVRFQPQQGKFKVYIIDEVHMLSASAFNAFLKTLEEPPPHVIFILATTEKHKILPTILSRCQTYDFKRIQVKEMADHLSDICKREGINANREALHIIAQKADGSLRDALSLFDRIVALRGTLITYEDVITNLNILDYEYYFRCVDALLVQDLSKLMLLFDDVIRNGFEGDLFISGLADHFRQLLVSRDEKTLHLLEAGETLKERYLQQASLTPASFMLNSINILNDCDINYKTARNKRIHVEMALIKMCFLQQTIELANLNLKAFPEAIPDQKKNNELDHPSGQLSGRETTTPETVEPTAVNNVHLPAEVKTPSENADKTVSSNTEEPIFNEQEQDYLKLENKQHQKGFSHLKPSIPTLQSLETLHEEVAEEIAVVQSQEESQIQLEEQKVLESWGNYISSIDRESVKMILKNATVRVTDNDILVEVGTNLAENTIRQEAELVSFLCRELGVERLNLLIKINPAKATVIENQTRPMTDSEKYWSMKSQNPLVDELRKKLDLRIERE